MSAEIPTGYRLPLVKEGDWRLPEPTMDAILGDVADGVDEQGSPVNAAISNLMVQEIGDPDTAIGGALSDTIDAALEGFDPESSPLQLVHGDDASFPRPDRTGPVWWIGSVAPSNRLPGDSYFIVEDEPAPEPWSPTKIPALLGWYSARDSGVADGATVASWPDLSGNGRSMILRTGTPVYDADGLNGTPAVSTVAAAATMRTDAFASTGTGALTFFLTGHASGNSASTGSFFDGQAAGTATFYRLSGAGWGLRRSADSSVPGFNSPSADGLPHDFVVITDGANSKILVDGAEVASGTAGSDTLTALSLFARFGNGQSLRGAIGDMFWMSGVADTETIAAARAWMRQRAGLA